MKGRRWHEAVKGAIYLVSVLKMKDKAKTLAKNLSPMDRRKLSFAIAILGDTKVVLLDEPTLGMDPENRRLCWNILMVRNY